MQAQVFPIALPNRGIVVNKPEEFLAEQLSPYSRNMQFLNENLQGRGGLGKFDTDVLSGPVLAQPKFVDLYGNKYFMFCTPSDIYSYDFGNARFDILTPTYSTGTIKVDMATPNKVVGDGTSWLANLKAGDYIKFYSGNVHTGSTWYKILSVDSDTLLTLTENATPTAEFVQVTNVDGDTIFNADGSAVTNAEPTAVDYVARKTFTGSDIDFWDWVQFSDENLGEVLLMTNGVAGEFIYWTGTGEVTAITGLPTGVTAGKYLSVYGGRVHLAHTIEGGGVQRQRNRWSDVANCVSWQDDDFQDLADEPTEIRGMTKFNGYHVIFKEKEAYVGRYVGGDYTFEWEISAQAFGCRSALSIVTRNDYIYYYGHDQKFHRFNLLQDDVISEQIFPETMQFDPNYDAYIFGGKFERFNEIRWFCPYGSTTKNNYAVVWNYQQNIIQVWEYKHPDACCSIGSYFRTTDVYADDPIYGNQYADETGGYADDSEFLASGEISIYGGYDGIVRVCDSGFVDDGYSYTRVLRLKRINFGLLNNIKRLWKQQWWLLSELSGSVNLRIRVDDKTSFESASNTISLISTDSSKDVIKANITWDKQAQDFQPEIYATNHFSVLGVLNFFYPKRTTVRR